MTAAVIVSTARTPLGKSWKGAFNMTHGATLGGHAVKAAVERAGIDAAEVDDVIMGCATPEGATPQQVDKAIEKFGFAMGPFRMGDLAGNDIGWAIRKRRTQERPNMLYSRTADKLCELGRFGQKTGAGWYDYKEGKRDAIPSKLVEEMIAEHRKSLSVTPRKISDEEIVQRLVFALVNEGSHILEDKIAARASDIDMVYITGYGFPMHRGGPMLYADQVGLFNVVQAMKRFQKNPLDDAKFWEPAPLLAKLAAEGKTFN